MYYQVIPNSRYSGSSEVRRRTCVKNRLSDKEEKGVCNEAEKPSREMLLEKWENVVRQYTAHTVSTNRLFVDAFFDMAGKRYVQEHRGDDATLQILGNIPYAYQIGILVCKYIRSKKEYPTPDTVFGFMMEMENEGVFGPS